MGKAGNPRVNAMLPRPGERHSFGRKLSIPGAISFCSIPMMKSLLRCACEAAETIIRGSFSSFCNPRSEVGRRVLEPDTSPECRPRSTGTPRPVRAISSSLEYRSEPNFACWVTPSRFRPGAVPDGVGHFMVKGVIVVLLAVKGGGRRDADHVILGGVISSESCVMDRTELRAFDDGSGSFERLGQYFDWWRSLATWMPSVWSRLKTFDHRTNGIRDGPAVFPHNQVPGIVPLFEDLVVDDGRGFLTLLHVPTKVERLFKAEPEGRLKSEEPRSKALMPRYGLRETMF